MPGLSSARARIEPDTIAVAIRRGTRGAGLQSRGEELRFVSHAEDRSTRLAFQIHRSSDTRRQTGRDVSVLTMMSGDVYKVSFRSDLAIIPRPGVGFDQLLFLIEETVKYILFVSAIVLSLGAWLLPTP